MPFLQNYGITVFFLRNYGKSAKKNEKKEEKWKILKKILKKVVKIRNSAILIGLAC